MIPVIAFAAAAFTSLALAGVVLTGRSRGRLQWSFALGMAGFAAESIAAAVLLTRTEVFEDRMFWLQILEILSLLLPVPWACFAALLAYPKGTTLPLGWRLSVAGIAGIAIAASGFVAVGSAFRVSEVSGPFYAAQLGSAGRLAVIVQTLATVGILGAIEFCLRRATRDTRWRIKYLILGLSGIFLVRFYFLSQVLLFHVLMAEYLTTQGAAIVVGNLLIGASLARDRLLNAQMTVSQQMLYRSVVLGALGLYLFVVGGLGWLLNNLGMPEELLWGSLVVFVSILGLAVLLLSENARWRVKRLLARHVYRSKYDYREQWTAFTTRMASLLTIEDLAPQLLTAVMDAVGTAKGLLYLADSRDARYHLAAAVEVTRPAAALDANAPLLARLGRDRRPVPLEGAFDLPAQFAEGGIAVPLYWRDTLTGVLLVGPERARAPYTQEDFEFLETVGRQLAGAILTARFSETLAQSREFEAFHRLTSFVVHDLKNSVSALSMLSQNALTNFDDPEFQRDAIKTLSRTVDRMKGLLTRLSAAPGAAPLQFRLVDLAGLAREAVKPLTGTPRVRLTQKHEPLPAVFGDQEAMLQVFQNLVTNAVEALDGDGEITVRTYQDRDSAVFSVTDSGCGISEDFLRKSLFTPFRSTKKGGWGIGLYQAKGIVEAHGGTIEVSSTEGVGSTFAVRLPMGSR